MSRVRVLAVDDNDDFLDGVSIWLRDSTRLELVGKAHSGASALERIGELTPDLVIMDVAMDDLNGFEATRRIKSRPGSPRVVLLTFHTSEAARLEAWAAGADGFVDKAKVTEQLMPIISDLFPAPAPRATTTETQTHLPRQQGPPRDLSD